MTSRKWVAAFVIAATTALAPSANADDRKPDAKDAKEGRKEAKEDRKEAKEGRKEAKEDKKDLKDAQKDLKDAKKDAREAGASGAAGEGVKDARSKVAEARRKLKETREERRKSARTGLRDKWGKELLQKPAVRAELRLHAMRMAKLRQMKHVAVEGEKKELEARVDKLIDKENTRHATRMDALKAKNGEDK
jgi:colicin import membrane protein